MLVLGFLVVVIVGLKETFETTRFEVILRISNSLSCYSFLFAEMVDISKVFDALSRKPFLFEARSTRGTLI